MAEDHRARASAVTKDIKAPGIARDRVDREAYRAVRDVKGREPSEVRVRDPAAREASQAVRFVKGPEP